MPNMRKTTLHTVITAIELEFPNTHPALIVHLVRDLINAQASEVYEILNSTERLDVDTERLAYWRRRVVLFVNRW